MKQADAGGRPRSSVAGTLARPLQPEHRGVSARSHFEARASPLHTAAVAAWRSNPLRLAVGLRAGVTAGLSFMVAVFFTFEIWDVGNTMGAAQLGAFAAVSVAATTASLYRAFSSGARRTRSRQVPKAVALTGSVLLAVFLTVATSFVGFFLAAYPAAAAFFPRPLMRTFPTVTPALAVADHVKVAAFSAAVGTLAASLGSRGGGATLVRRVLFVEEDD